MKADKTVIVLALAGMLATTATAQVTPHGWRGPARDGIYPETGLLQSWPAGGPEKLWETLDAGKGYSSPVVVGDRIYLTGMNETEDREIFSAYGLDGKKIYEVTYGSVWTETYPETRTTPAVEGNKAFVISGAGEIVCLNTANGDVIWQVDGGKVFERQTGTWGTSECPLVYDGKVIYQPGGNQAAMVALNTENGEVVWKSRPLGEHSSYVNPLLITYNGKRQILAAAGQSVFGVDPDTGEIKWTFDDWGKDKRGEKIAPNTPLHKDGKVFYSMGYDMGSFMLQLNDDLSDVSLVWRNPDLDAHHGGYVLVNGIIYGSNWTNNNAGNWIAADWNTGETKFDTAWTGNGKGSTVYADGKLYCYDERRGTVGLVNPTPEKFDVVSEFRITKGEGPHWAHPVIDNGVLYIRHGNALMAFKIA